MIHHICQRPAVSVVIATLNRPTFLNRCLEALVLQTLPSHDYEVVVVDDGPHFASKAVVRAWCGRSPKVTLRYGRSAWTHGPAAARNVGWRAARASVIAFTDDDCIPARDWLMTGLRAVTKPEVGAVWGRVIVPLTTDPTDWERNVAGLERAPCATAN